MHIIAVASETDFVCVVAFFQAVQLGLYISHTNLVAIFLSSVSLVMIQSSPEGSTVHDQMCKIHSPAL